MASEGSLKVEVVGCLLDLAGTKPGFEVESTPALVMRLACVFGSSLVGEFETEREAEGWCVCAFFSPGPAGFLGSCLVFVVLAEGFFWLRWRCRGIVGGFAVVAGFVVLLMATDRLLGLSGCEDATGFLTTIDAAGLVVSFVFIFLAEIGPALLRLVCFTTGVVDFRGVASFIIDVLVFKGVFCLDIGVLAT